MEIAAECSVFTRTRFVPPVFCEGLMELLTTKYIGPNTWTNQFEELVLDLEGWLSEENRKLAHAEIGPESYKVDLQFQSTIKPSDLNFDYQNDELLRSYFSKMMSQQTKVPERRIAVTQVTNSPQDNGLQVHFQIMPRRNSDPQELQSVAEKFTARVAGSSLAAAPGTGGEQPVQFKVVPYAPAGEKFVNNLSAATPASARLSYAVTAVFAAAASWLLWQQHV